ncbi:MAG: lysophospholipid acyltransferase family protein [Beijerinckiaceae bacterium]
MSRMGAFRAYIKIAGLGVTFAALYPAQRLALRAGDARAATIPMRFHRAALRALSVRITETGTPPPAGPVLIVANHLSWIDICVIGASRPVSFVAKSDVESWPIFGNLARLQRTVFVDRTRRTAAGQAAQGMAQRLAEGGALVLFAEGTTNDGQRILPFRSALVGAAQAAASAAGDRDTMPLQALTVAYVRRDGLPLSRRDLPDIAWHGDMELAPHLMARLRGGPVEARLHWGAHHALGPHHDRKAATRAIEQEVRETYAALRQGRTPPILNSTLTA